MIVLNGMPFIEYSLKSVYDFAYEIIIVEGAVENCMFAANPDGSSTDGTVEFIKSFPDPQKKIRLVQGRWPEKCEMQNEALKYVTGDYVWLIDSDEVYRSQDVEKIKEILKSDSSITQVNFIPNSFWKGFDYIFVSSKFFEDSCHCRRLFKYVPGAMFTTHRPPTMVWPGCDRTTEQMNLLDGTTTRQMGIIFYHYSYVLDKQVKQKIELYRRYGWGKHWKLDLLRWYEDCYLKWQPWNRDEIDSRYPIWTGDIDSHTVLFNGTHPKVVIDYILNDGASSANRAAMQHVVNVINEIKRSFPRQQINAIETGTIRSFHEKHFSTYHISCALGNRGSLISVDISADSIRISRQVCHGSRNVEFVHSDSIKYLKVLKDIRFHFALLDSVNDKNYILEEFRLIVPMMVEGGILIVDDAGITRDGSRIDTSVAAQKGHLIWEFLRSCGVRPAVLETTFGHGTQLKIAMTRENLAKIERGLGAINRQTEGLSSISGLGDDAMSRSFVGNTRKSIVWVRTDSIGDAVLSASMLPHIWGKYQGARITVVCQEHIAELYEACPYVDDIVVFDRQRALLEDRYREEIVERLRALKPDVSLNSVYSREALTDWFAIKCGAEERIALEGNLCNISAELRRVHNQLYTKLLPSHGEHKPEIERHKDFLHGIDIDPPSLKPMVWTTAEDEKFAERFFEENNLSPENTIALFPSAQHSKKIYEEYKSVVHNFERFDFVILGGRDAEDYAGEICADSPKTCHNLAGKTTIRRMTAIIRKCCLYLGSDSAGAHIGCAVGTPNVVVLGGGHLGRFVPYSPLTLVVCLPLECFGCNWNCRYESPYCVKDVAPEVVVEALKAAVEGPSEKIRVFIQGDSLWEPAPGRPAWKMFEGFLDIDNIEVVPIEGRSNAVSARHNNPDVRIQGPKRLQDAKCRPGVAIRTDTGLTITTSIAPRRIEAQIEAIESWMKLGFDVVSINCAEEIESLRGFFPEVRFVRAQRDARELLGKPLVYFEEFLKYFQRSGSEICGIVNSDIHLVADEGIISFIKSEAENSLIYGSRTDVDSPDVLAGDVCQTGFDFFFFDRSLISCYPESEFCIGMPWWDYWAPLIPAVEGFQTKRLVSPFAYHIRHTCEWEKEKWLFLAKKLFAYLREGFDRDLVSDPQSLWTSLGRTFAAHHRRYLRERGMEDTSQMSVGIIFPSALEFLEGQSQQITYKNREPAIPQHSFETSGNSEDVSIHEADSMVRSGHGQEAECDVSIVLCTKDRAGLLDQMLGSLREAASGVAYEIIVVEGGSSDNTLDVLGRHNVREIYSESQWLGPGRHSWPQLYNFGFSKARGRWAMYASDDIVFSSGAIARAVELLEKQKDEVAGGIFFYKNIHPTREDWARYGIDFTQGAKLLMNYGLIRLESFRRVGGFDEAYRFYCADTDFCYKLYENGRQLIPLPGCFLTHNNLLDVQKQANADASGRDIELCRRRWSHFVGAEMPRPGRLLWQDNFSDAFGVPAGLEKIDSGIESFWRGLACFQQGLFAEAEQAFLQAVKSFCDHKQVLWYLARAADKCGDGALAEKAATAVVRLAPDFEPGLDFLIRVARQEQRSAAPVLCSAKSGSINTDNAYAVESGLENSYEEGPVYSDAWGGLNARNQATTETTVRRTSTKSHCERSEKQLRRKIEKFNKVVVWGLKTQEHTHAYIHRHFFSTLEKLGASVVLVDDRRENEDVIESNDLVISVDVSSSHLPIRDNVYYCLHNCSDDIHQTIDPSRSIQLQTYTNSVELAGQMWDQVTFFDGKNRTLFQPWATDLLGNEFEEPILERSGNVVFWVGSIWNDRLDRGNVNEIEMLKDVLEKRNIRFIHLQDISDSLNIKYVRRSLIAPAIAGRWQVENNYLPCRMWKNISYGRLGVSNVRKFDDIFNDCTVKGRSIEELIDNTLSLPLSKYRDMIYEQQEIVKSHHTYVNRLLNIIRAFEAVENY